MCKKKVKKCAQKVKIVQKISFDHAQNWRIVHKKLFTVKIRTEKACPKRNIHVHRIHNWKKLWSFHFIVFFFCGLFCTSFFSVGNGSRAGSKIWYLGFLDITFWANIFFFMPNDIYSFVPILRLSKWLGSELTKQQNFLVKESS